MSKDYQKLDDYYIKKHLTTIKKSTYIEYEEKIKALESKNKNEYLFWLFGVFIVLIILLSIIF